MLDQLDTTNLQDCCKKIIVYYDFFRLHIKNIVQTLLGLQSLIKPLVSKNQDILKIMLMLYVVFDKSKAEGIPEIIIIIK